MDTLNTDDLFDTSWLDDTPLDMPEISPEEEALVTAMMEQAKAVIAAKAQLLASRRKKEDNHAGPSEKISIRIPRPLMKLLREGAALAGMPYQTFINLTLHNAATR